MPRPPPIAFDDPNYSFHDDHLLRKPPTVHHQLIDVHPRRGLLARTRDIPVPIGAVRAPGRAVAGQLEIVQGLARALEDRHGHELREHVVDLQRDPRPVTIREQLPAQDERDRGRRVKRVRVVLLELHDGWRGLAPRAAHRRPSRPKPEPQHCPGVLHHRSSANETDALTALLVTGQPWCCRALEKNYAPPLPAVNRASVRASPERRVVPRRSAPSRKGNKYLLLSPKPARNTPRRAAPAPRDRGFHATPECSRPALVAERPPS